ncbi:MAG: alpha/beta hydrolase [Bacteroidales bacterium]
MHKYQWVEQGTSLHEAEKAIILIHGRGAPPEDILGLADYFDTQNTYVAAPQATQYVWYPLSFLAPREQNQPWLNSALENIERLILHIENHIPAQKIYIMGFSQGACLSAEVASRNARRYAGVGIFTGGLIGESVDPKQYNGDFAGTPVYITNGDKDPHIPLQRTHDTVTQISQMGAQVTFDIFPDRPHTILMEEINKARSLFGL